MKRKYALLKRNILVLAICYITLTSTLVKAQATQDVVAVLNTIRAALDSMVNTAATYLFQTPPNIGNILVTNKAQYTAGQTIAPNIQDLNNQDIQKSLSPNTQNPNEALVQMASIQASDTVIANGLGNIPAPLFSQTTQSTVKNALLLGDKNLDFENFLNPCTATATAGSSKAPNCGLSYNNADLQKNGLNYIRFVSDYATPISNFSLSSFPDSQLSAQQKLTIQNSANYQTYQVQRRALIARQSALLSSLYYIYQKRLPIPSIHASDTALGIETPSKAQIDHYIATWRAASPTWYTQMSTAAPSAVARETLFVLAEIQKELHQIRLDNERLIAITAINQFSSLQAGKQILSITEKQVSNQISDQIKKNATNGTTNQTGQQQAQTSNLKQQSEEVKAAQQQAIQQANPK
jgi:hypothetical protein